MFKHALVTVGLVLSLTVPLAAASSKGVQVVQLDNMLRIYEEHADFIPDTIPDIEGDSHGAYLLKLLQIAEHHYDITVALFDGIPLQGIPKGMTLWGYYNKEANEIYLDINQSPNGLLATLVHEIAHALGPDKLWATQNGQVFAEAVSAMVCRQLKLNVTRASFAYLQQFPERHEVLWKYTDELDSLVNQLVKELR